MAGPSACIDQGDTAWMMFSFLLVLLMMPGLALFTAGLLRSKNSLTVIIQVFSGLAINSVLWAVIGYSLTFGPTWHGLIGRPHHAFLVGVPAYDCSPHAPTVPAVLYATFQMMFAVISPLLLTGAYAERLRFRPFLVLTVAWEVLVYYPMAHAIFDSQGWLAQLGALDFAGGIVIHATAGVSSLVAAVYLGPRVDFEASGGTYPPSNLPLSAVGTAMLLLGWFGFNAGSAESAGGLAAAVVVNTQLAGSSCALVAIMFAWWDGRVGSTAVMNGLIAGLAGVTPACGYISPQSALALGLFLGVAAHYSEHLVRHRLGIDDALDVSSVHGTTGVVGSIAIGLLSSDEDTGTRNGLFFGGGWYLLGVQTLALVVAMAWAGLFTYLILRAMTAFGMQLRASEEDEIRGLDVMHGETAYHELVLSVDDLRTVLPSHFFHSSSRILRASPRGPAALSAYGSLGMRHPAASAGAGPGSALLDRRGRSSRAHVHGGTASESDSGAEGRRRRRRAARGNVASSPEASSPSSSSSPPSSPAARMLPPRAATGGH